MNRAKLRFEELSIEDRFKSLLEEYKRKAQEEVLYDVMTRFYFADWTRQCDYEKMTSEEVVEAVVSVCKKLEEHWNYSLDNDILGS